MSSKTSSLLIVFLIVGAAVGYGISFSLYQPQINSLRSEVSTLQTEKTLLQTNYNSLKANYTSLTEKYNQLNKDYSNLNSAYSKLSKDYSSLNQTHVHMMGYYRTLSDDVKDFQELLYSYTSCPDSFPRTLNIDAISKVSSAVIAAGVLSTDSWTSYQRIYNYVVSNIKYAYDIEMPYISGYSYVSQDEYQYVTGFSDKVKTSRNYLQIPELTLTIKQGDCDDQAILAYAMIKYYMKYIYGTEYLLYIMHVEFTNGEAHMADLLPVQGGQVSIIDPAGHYFTSSVGTIASKEPLPELQSYSSYWASEGGISYIKLYKINIRDGSYTIVKEGTISEVATFLR